MSGKWNNRDELRKVWNTVSEKIPGKQEYIFTIICPRCSTTILRYIDGKKLKPKEVEHCGVSDTFYISQELPIR